MKYTLGIISLCIMLILNLMVHVSAKKMDSIDDHVLFEVRMYSYPGDGETPSKGSELLPRVKDIIFAEEHTHGGLGCKFKISVPQFEPTFFPIAKIINDFFFELLNEVKDERYHFYELCKKNNAHGFLIYISLTHIVMKNT